MAKDRDKEAKEGHTGKQPPEINEQPSVTGDAATKAAAEEVVSPLHFDPDKMKHDMEVFMTSREDDEKVEELSSLYAGLGKVANMLIEFEPEINLDAEGKKRAVEAMDQLGDKFFEILNAHYAELEDLISEMLYKLKQQGPAYVVQSTREHYRYNRQFREDLLAIYEKIIHGENHVSKKELSKLSNRYKMARKTPIEISDQKIKLMSEPNNMREGTADNVLETCGVRAFLKELGGSFKHEDNAGIYTETEGIYRQLYGGQDPADFLMHIIKRSLGYQSNTAGQGQNVIITEENFSLTFDDYEGDEVVVDNQSDKVGFLLARTIRILRLMRFVKYQKKLFHLRDEIKR